MDWQTLSSNDDRAAGQRTDAEPGTQWRRFGTTGTSWSSVTAGSSCDAIGREHEAVVDQALLVRPEVEVRQLSKDRLPPRSSP
jgi:hypothetical protein